MSAFKVFVEINNAGGKPDNCPPLSDLPCLFDTDWSDLLLLEVSAGTEMDGR
jgi:hypothetical protein